MTAPAKCDVTGLLNETQGSCVQSHVAGLIPVEYEIHFDTDLSLPYAIYWNGRTQPENRVALTKKGSIATVRIMARSGQRVGLYLGSDASPLHRKEMLFPITVGGNGIRVIIQSKTGLHDHRAEVSMDETHITRNVVEPGSTDKLDIYQDNYITGNIWLQFSHTYTQAEALAQAQEAGETDAGILAALRALYGGDVTKAAGYTVAFVGKHRCKINFQSDADSNCTQNIQRYLSLGGFSGATLPRVHPRSWIALLQAARDANVGTLEITSGWRPMTGKAPHRIGLGLDVKSAKSTAGNTLVFDKDSPALWSGWEEKVAHGDWIKAEKSLNAANNELAAAQMALKAAKGDGKVLAQRKKDDAETKQRVAIATRNSSRKNYETKHKGSLADTLEVALYKNPLIRQVFDPLLMNQNTRDNSQVEVNHYETSNEIIHKNHMHITAFDFYLTP